MKKSYELFYIKKGYWIYIRKILPDATLIMLEKTMDLATILLVQYRFLNHWSIDKHNAKVWEVN